jgi:hypothetical protein
MIPSLEDNGYLPPGIYLAGLDEIERRFGGQSEIRRAQMESLRWLAPLAIAAGISRLVINGSFVTDRIEPNDVDCVLLIDEDASESEELTALQAGLPFLDIHLVNGDEFDLFIEKIFASDRHDLAKGMIEVQLWE